MRTTSQRPSSDARSISRSSHRGARAVALQALLTLDQRPIFADEVLDRLFDRAQLDARDRALVLELVYGVLRHRTRLDWAIDRVSQKPVERLPAIVRTALRLGAYQLLHLDKIPASAAVHETVALVKSVRRGPSMTWAGYVNALLRTLSRDPLSPSPQLDDPAASLSLQYSCPSWLIERWLGRYSATAVESLCRATLEIPPLTLRVNTLKRDLATLLRELQDDGYAAEPCRISPVGIVLTKCGPVGALPAITKGHCYVEDEGAQLIPLLLDAKPGERILDACAAPGGKSTHLAALMADRGELVAVDRDPDRLARLRENCARLDITMVTPVVGELTQDLSRGARLPPNHWASRPFDRMLLDAPCSALGVLRRHPEAKWRKNASVVAQHQALQLDLIERVSGLLRAGGVFVYSTCSTEPDENEEVIDQFCARHPEFHRESVAPWLPPNAGSLTTSRGDFSTHLNPHSMDVFYAARLRKASA